MFGQGTGSGFGGFGAQNSQQNTGGGFGATNTGGGFGTGTFGQPAQPQQNTGFGGGGGGGGGGGFGTNTQQTTGFGQTGLGFGQQAAAGGFGAQNKPFGAPATTGGGLFGNTTATTGGGFGGGFGQTAQTATTGFGTPAAATGGLFGQAKPTTPGFGATTGTGLFGGGTNTGTGFGAANNTATTGFGNTASGTIQPPINGTSNPTFEPYVEKDVATNAMNHFQTIAFMPAYQKFSLEELRLQDYAQNRKVASGPTAGGFGATGGFGTFGQQPQANGGFGQPQQPAATGGLFGQAQTTGTGFGQTNTSGGFGATNNNTAGGLFGQKPATTGGLFGQTTPATTAGGGLFGNSGGGFGANNTSTTPGFGQTAATGTGLFSQNNANQPKQTPGFAFGNTTQAAATGFGQAQTAGTGFGQTAAPATGSLFGQQQNAGSTFGQPAPASTNSAFGGGFGQNNNPQQQQQQQQQQPQTSAFSGFANTQQTQNKPFGAGFGATSMPSTTTGGGLFGSTPQNNQQQSGGGLFGKPFGQSTTTNSGGGLFGGGNSTTPATANTGLFGSGVASTQQPGGGLFGAQPQNQQSGLFGAKPATTGLFGGVANNTSINNGGGLFGGGNNNTNNQNQGNPAFGQNNNQNQGGGFNGSTSGGMFNNGQSLMGGNNMQASNMSQQGNQSFSSSLIGNNSPYGNQLIDYSQMGTSSPGPIATPLSGSTQKKKSAMIPHYKIAPRQPVLTPRVSQPFSRSASPFSTAPLAGGSLGRSFSGSSSRMGLGSSMFDVSSDDSVLSSSAFSPGSAHRPNLKTLVINRKLRDPDLFANATDMKSITEGDMRDDSRPKKVSFDQSAGQQSPDANSEGTLRPSPQPTSNNGVGFLRSTSRTSSNVASPTSNNSPAPAPAPAPAPEPSPAPPPPMEQVQANQVALVQEEDAVDSTGLQHGEYWMVPTVSKLGKIPREKLNAVPSLKVGRRGYGQISFDVPVDLTALDSLGEICGGVITFGDRVCTVYPPGWEKPDPGHGLNVPATITLEDCFPTDRENKKPIRDVDHPRYQFHLKRLKNVKDTEFVDYLVQEGIWVFKVKHFTAYGLTDDDGEEGESGVTPTQELQEDSFFSEDASYEEDSMNDTFDFKRVPNNHLDMEPDSDLEMDENVEADVTIDDASMLPSEDAQYSSSDLDSEDELTEIMSPTLDTVAIRNDDGQLVLADISCIASSRSVTPEPKLGVGRDWTDQLGQTISPTKKSVRFAEPDATPTKMGANAFGPLDLARNFFVADDDFESPYRTSTRTYHSPLTSRKKASGATRKRAYDAAAVPSDDKAAHKSVRPAWGPNGEIFYLGNIEGGRPRGFGDVKPSGMSRAKLSFTGRPLQSTYTQLDLQLAATTFEIDSYGVPFARLDKSLTFLQFANSHFGDASYQLHEKQVWQLSSILFDDVDITRGGPAPTELFMKIYLRDRARRDALSAFFEHLVSADVEKDVHTAITPEEAAVAWLTGHKIEDACASLLEGGDFRLASLLPSIGGDAKVREEVRRQLNKWRQDGVLAEIPIPIRAIYELVSGNTSYSAGVKIPFEDITPAFHFSERFGLDWKRTFALKLWYEIFEDEKLEKAVSRYAKELDGPASVQKPIPWYQEPGADDSRVVLQKDTNAVDVLWSLLLMYSRDEINLETVLLPRNIGPSPIDYRLSWQLRMLFSEKQIRDFTTLETAEQLTVDFAWQLEVEGKWEWAVFVLLHLDDIESRESTIRQVLGRQVPSAETDSKKVEFIQRKLLIPSKWIYEAKALHARSTHSHFAEVETLLQATAWNEAHKTILQNVAPACVINEDLPRLHEVLCKFTNVELVDDWMIGGQVYLDYISLTSIVNEYGGFSPLVPKSQGLPKGNSKRDIARRMLDALPKMEKTQFLQSVAISEVAKVLSGFVLRSEDLASDAAKILKLPLTEDQFLNKTLTLSLNLYKAGLGIQPRS